MSRLASLIMWLMWIALYFAIGLAGSWILVNLHSLFKLYRGMSL